VKEALRDLSKSNPGLLVGRDLCNERHKNVDRQLTEIKWTLRAVGAAVGGAVLTQILGVVF